VIISPSTEPAAVLLSQRPVERLQVMTPEDVAGGLAGDTMHTFNMHLRLYCSVHFQKEHALPEVTCMKSTADNLQCNANLLQLHEFVAIC